MCLIYEPGLPISVDDHLKEPILVAFNNISIGLIRTIQELNDRHTENR